MERAVILRLKFLAIVLMSFLTACGIKGNPIGPMDNENYVQNVSALEFNFIPR